MEGDCFKVGDSEGCFHLFPCQHFGSVVVSPTRGRSGIQDHTAHTRNREGSFLAWLIETGGRRGGLVVSALVHGSSGPGSSSGRGHCVVFLGKTLYSHSASLHPGE